MTTTRLTPSPAFPDLIACTGLSLRAFARRANLGFSTLMGLMYPAWHPGRSGGMLRCTAWILAKAYAEVAGGEAEAAFRLLIVEIPTHDHHDPDV